MCGFQTRKTSRISWSLFSLSRVISPWLSLSLFLSCKTKQWLLIASLHGRDPIQTVLPLIKKLLFTFKSFSLLVLPSLTLSIWRASWRPYNASLHQLSLFRLFYRGDDKFKERTMARNCYLFSLHSIHQRDICLVFILLNTSWNTRTIHTNDQCLFWCPLADVGMTTKCNYEAHSH